LPTGSIGSSGSDQQLARRSAIGTGLEAIRAATKKNR